MKKNNKKVLVSILCLTYNQRDFIKQAIDSFLMQETDFSYEILINDDGSTDGTKEIIQEYSKEHPNIHPVFHEENQYSKGERNMAIRYLLPRVQGEYIALCEGDDFWTDTTKLQRQVNFLEEHKDYALVFHPVRVFYDKAEKEDSIFPEASEGFTVEELLRWNFIQTNSVMYRARKEYKDMVFDATPGDWYLHLYHAQFGKIGFINRVMSAYRRHENGIWWGSATRGAEFLRSIIPGHQRLASEIEKIYSKDKKLVSIMKDSIRDLTIETIISNNYDSDIVKNMMKESPDIMSDIFSENLIQINALKQEIKSLNTTIDRQREDLAEKDAAILEKSQQITDVIESKSYKIGRKITFPYRLAKKTKSRHIKNKNV